MESVRTTIFLPVKTHRGLKQLASQQESSMARLITEAVQATYFPQEKKQSAKKLWGVAPKSDLTLKDFSKLKKNLRDSNL